MNKVFIFFIILFSYINLFEASPLKGQIKVIIKGLRNDKGIVQVSLFNSKEGFPSKYKKAYRITTNIINKNQSEAYFKDVPFGIYAISVLHDENENTKFETNFLGMPNEGVGSSNNVKNKFSSPSFNDAKFNFDTDNKIINIEINYW